MNHHKLFLAVVLLVLTVVFGVAFFSGLLNLTRPNGENAPVIFPDPDQKPYYALPALRVVDVTLPDDLAHFYQHNEGVGLESSPDRLVRLCALSEIEKVRWNDLHLIGSEPLDGWEDFSAYRIGISSFFDEIVYVVNAPSCKRGAIFATGVDVSGPGGEGPDTYEASLVLASSFQEWLKSLERFGWTEYGLVPGGIEDLPESVQIQIRRYYKALNPGIDWGGE